jgi:Tol biopolymer transport system component
VDRTGGERPVLDEPGAFSDPSISTDGRQLAVAIEGAHQDLWLVDMPRRTLSRLTFDPSEEFSPRWTPDGLRLFYALIEIGRVPEIAWRAADGSGNADHVLANDNLALIPGSIAPDGRTLAYVEIVTDDNADIWALPLGGGRRPVPFVKTPFNEFGPEFSPDGRFLAYVSNESGRLEIYVRPFPGPGPKRQVSVGGGTSAVWSKSGGEIFYRNGDAVMAAAVAGGPEFSSAAPRPLFRGDYEESARPDWPRNYDVTPDGQQFLMIKPDPDGRPTQARIVFNWFEELKRQAAKRVSILPRTT